MILYLFEPWYLLRGPGFNRENNMYGSLHLSWNILHFFFQFGLKALTALPGFITSSVHSVLFSLLAHPQLSIREHATKALSAILSRCEFEVRQSLHMYMMDCMSHMLTRLQSVFLLSKEVWARGSRQEEIWAIPSCVHTALFHSPSWINTCYTCTCTYM